MSIRFGIRPIGPLGRGVAGSKSLVSTSMGLAQREGGGGPPSAPVTTGIGIMAIGTTFEVA